MAEFSTVVELYRYCGYPEYDGRSFSATVELNEKIQQLIASISSVESLGRFEDVEIDEEPIIPEAISAASGKSVNFIFITARNNAERFYTTLTNFISTNSLKRGIPPQNYYICEMDYFSSDPVKAPPILIIEKLCSIIVSLSDLAHFHDTKTSSDNYRLVFVKNSDSKSSSVVLETSFSEELITKDINNSVLLELTNPSNHLTPHYSEKIGTFRNTLVEYSLEHDYGFVEIVRNWDEFISLYNNNLSTYMSGFSFHKARKEVANAETDSAEKTSKVISEISSKILAIPVSLVASLGLLKVSSKSEMLIIFSGIILTSLFSHFTLSNQRNQLERIDHAKNIVFKPLANSEKKYPTELKCDIDSALAELDKNYVKCQKTITKLMFISWFPTSVAAGIFISKLF